MSTKKPWFLHIISCWSCCCGFWFLYSADRASVVLASYIMLIVLLWLLSLGASALACMFFLPSVPHSFLPSFTPLLLPHTGTSCIPSFSGIAFFAVCPRPSIGRRCSSHVAFWLYSFTLMAIPFYPFYHFTLLPFWLYPSTLLPFWLYISTLFTLLLFYPFTLLPFWLYPSTLLPFHLFTLLPFWLYPSTLLPFYPFGYTLLPFLSFYPFTLLAVPFYPFTLLPFCSF